MMQHFISFSYDTYFSFIHDIKKNDHVAGNEQKAKTKCFSLSVHEKMNASKYFKTSEIPTLLIM